MSESHGANHLDSKVLLEVVRHQTQAICEEMSNTLQRTSHTVFVNETADFATGLSTPEGELFAYPQSVGVSVMVNANLATAIEAVGDMTDGDIIITNDPYTSGSLASHLPDTNLFKPVFVDGRLVAFSWAYVHSTDVGGKLPGSLSPSSSDIFQEGTRIPPSKLYEAGALNPRVLRMALDNCRVPDDNWGDIKAVVAALNTGAARVSELCQKHGRSTFEHASHQLLDYAQERANAVFATLPDGEYEFTDFLDSDFVTDNPVRLNVRLVVDAGRLTLDYSRCDVQSSSSFNIPSLGRAHPWLVYRLISFLYTEDPSIPINAGLLRDVRVVTKVGSIVDCEFPAAIGMRTTTSIRLMDALLGSLSMASPGRFPAAPAGTMVPVVVAELDLEKGGRRVQTVEPLAGGTGAANGMDGIDGRDVGLANLRNTPIEIVEADSSVIVREYSIRPDSGGAGRWRGGAGVILEFEVGRPDTIVTARGMERQRFRAWGAEGGDSGALGRAILNPGLRSERALPRIDGLVLNPGDVVRLEMPGGGGYGDPLRRDIGAVLADWLRGVVTVDGAAQDYGVCICDGRVDVAETTELRRTASAHRSRAGLGAERREYESRWPASAHDERVSLLYDLPVAIRPYANRRLIEMVETDRGADIAEALQRAWSRLSQELDQLR